MVSCASVFMESPKLALIALMLLLCVINVIAVGAQINREVRVGSQLRQQAKRETALAFQRWVNYDAESKKLRDSIARNISGKTPEQRKESLKESILSNKAQLMQVSKASADRKFHLHRLRTVLQCSEPVAVNLMDEALLRWKRRLPSPTQAQAPTETTAPMGQTMVTTVAGSKDDGVMKPAATTTNSAGGQADDAPSTTPPTKKDYQGTEDNADDELRPEPLDNAVEDDVSMEHIRNISSKVDEVSSDEEHSEDDPHEDIDSILDEDKKPDLDGPAVAYDGDAESDGEVVDESAEFQVRFDDDADDAPNSDQRFNNDNRWRANPAADEETASARANAKRIRQYNDDAEEDTTLAEMLAVKGMTPEWVSRKLARMLTAYFNRLWERTVTYGPTYAMFFTLVAIWSRIPADL